jgi:hypothetical protein
MGVALGATLRASEPGQERASLAMGSSSSDSETDELFQACLGTASQAQIKVSSVERALEMAPVRSTRPNVRRHERE